MKMNRPENMSAMASSAYSSTTFDLNGSGGIDTFGHGDTHVPRALMLNHTKPTAQNFFFQMQLKEAQMSSRRIVKVVIADPNENLPLADCLLFSGEEKLTDATDQELFFELDIKELLEKHNAKRIKTVDKKIKDRTEYLEPAKVRDLKMVVVTVASL